jgi:hypothetical protein
MIMFHGGKGNKGNLINVSTMRMKRKKDELIFVAAQNFQKRIS